MKKIIEGKIYDTKTAEQIFFTSSSVGKSDFSWWEEELYKTKKGAFFLVGEGGPASRWARTLSQNTWSEGSGLEALSEAEALAWAERKCPSEIIEKYFSSSLTVA